MIETAQSDCVYFALMIEEYFVKFILGILCLVYLLMPNLGIIELIPDAIPFIGHLDELAVTFLMTHFFGIGWGKDGEKPDVSARIMFVIVGGLALLYLVYPSLSTFELLPDAIPFAGNADEVLASLVLVYINNSLRTPQLSDGTDNENALIIEGQLVEETSGQS